MTITMTLTLVLLTLAMVALNIWTCLKILEAVDKISLDKIEKICYNNREGDEEDVQAN